MCEQWIPAPFPNGPGYEAILEYAMFNSTDAIQSTRLNNIACTLYGDNQTLEMSNSYIPPWGVVVLHIGIGHNPTPVCKTTPQGGI